jgi:methyl-accepting chemotaxis protein
MRSISRLPIGVKLPLIGALAALIPSLSLTLAMLWQNHRVMSTVNPAFEQLAMMDLQHVADGVYAMCASRQELFETTTSTDPDSALPSEDIDFLRQSIMNVKVGETGYVYVLRGKGDRKGTYVISPGGAQDGANVWEEKDADGNPFIQNIVAGALELGPTENRVFRYPPRQNQDDTHPRMRVVMVKYFEPWDWVIGAGSYEDEFYQARNQTAAIMGNAKKASLLLALAALILSVFSSIWLAKGVTGPVLRMMEDVKALGQATIEGRLSTRIDTSKHYGDYLKVVEGMNNTLDSVVGPLDVAAGLITPRPRA